MWRLKSRFSSRSTRSTTKAELVLPARGLALVVVVGLVGLPTQAHAQACCAGGSAITPGRLQLHEDALVGAELKAASVVGSYDASGRYMAAPAGTLEGAL